MDMKTNTPQTIHLKDYKEPSHNVESIHLSFEIFEDHTLLTSETKYIQKGSDNSLELDGEEIELISISLGDQEFSDTDYVMAENKLHLKDLPSEFTLRIKTKLYPDQNKTLSGLYKSGGLFCTQCEAEGFRRMTYFLDRPDVMTSFTTRIEADQKKYPQLLANGNKIDSGSVENGRHFATWNDPFKKPSYLFALVAGDLHCHEDSFKTKSGRQVKLQVFVDKDNHDKCAHAMDSLKKSMAWDEEAYGREYDLDIFMLVAVRDFNFGAMENKGLNIFNAKFVLASPETATDGDYEGILAVVGHEYFHNWSGNRVTCRDWFQLSLKEGFTVLREQQFTEDMTSHSVARIDQVATLRSRQFTEDAGPMAHPVRPKSYIEIDNFYTATIYEKGAELIRMQKLILGDEAFRKASDHYFAKHDGQAVTIEDFVTCMEESSGKDLTDFRLWYDQPGTPHLKFSWEYNETGKTFTLHVEQTPPETPNDKNQKPVPAPIKLALLSSTNGSEMNLNLKGYETAKELVVMTKAQKETFVFENVETKPVPSLLRHFSAPVTSERPYTDDELLFLIAHDSDEFNRWESAQIFYHRLLEKALSGQTGYPASFFTALEETVTDESLDPVFRSRLLSLPKEGDLIQKHRPADPEKIHQIRRGLQKEIAQNLESVFTKLITSADNTDYKETSHEAVGRRALATMSMGYLSFLQKEAHQSEILKRFQAAKSMTEKLGALSSLSDKNDENRQKAFDEFYNQWKSDDLVLDKWFQMQALSDLPNSLEHVKSLCSHEKFNIKNPNRASALLGAFSYFNLRAFHDISGEGYTFLREKISEIDEFNPSLATRFLNAFKQLVCLDEKRQSLIRDELEILLAKPKLSKACYEMGSKFLEQVKDVKAA
jgi:aminopeptidase N